MRKTLLAPTVLALAACTMAPVKSHRPAPADDAWTARAAAARAEAERPRGTLETWELKRPPELNRPTD